MWFLKEDDPYVFAIFPSDVGSFPIQEIQFGQEEETLQINYIKYPSLFGIFYILMKSPDACLWY